MRALAMLATLVAYSLAHSHDQTTNGTIPRHILSALGIEDQNPVYKIFNCIQNLGPTKCLSALSIWRAKRAVEMFGREQPQFNLTADVERFPWENYSNSTQEQLYSQLCDDTEKLLQYRKLSLTMIPGYTLELKSKEDGKLNVDVFKSNEVEIATARGSMKKWKKKFYSIVPLLLIPGLIMAAILPFVLPALKMATMGAVMLNNMALTGAIFSILRDNAFNDHSRPKVKYINAGYRNEEKLYNDKDYSKDDGDSIEYAASNVHYTYQDDYGDVESVENRRRPSTKYITPHGFYSVNRG